MSGGKLCVGLNVLAVLFLSCNLMSQPVWNRDTLEREIEKDFALVHQKSRIAINSLMAKQSISLEDLKRGVSSYLSFAKRHSGRPVWVKKAFTEILKVYRGLIGKLSGQERVKALAFLENELEIAFTGALEHAPMQAEVAEIYKQIGEYSKARDAYEKVLKYRPESEWFSAWVSNKIADIYLIEGKLEQAEEGFTNVATFYQEQIGQVVRAKVGLWRVHCHKGEMQKAREMLQEAMSSFSLLNAEEKKAIILQICDEAMQRRSRDKVVEDATELLRENS